MKLPEIIFCTNEIIAKSPNCCAAIIGEDGYPRAAIRSFCRPADVFNSYISTNLSGNLAQSIMKNNRMSICVHAGNDNITMIGEAEIVTNITIKEQMWNDWFINHYPEGINDIEYCVIKFTTQKLSLWVNREIVKLKIDDIYTVQSMCGLMCNTCDFKTSHNCAGCKNLKGKVFWGECPVAKCCNAKGYSHCGECREMPCDLLNSFSCGDDEHCDNPKGARLQMLKIWNERT